MGFVNKGCLYYILNSRQNNTDGIRVWSIFFQEEKRKSKKEKNFPLFFFDFWKIFLKKIKKSENFGEKQNLKKSKGEIHEEKKKKI